VWSNLFIYLTPCIPLSFEGEGEETLRGAKPLLDTLLLSQSKESSRGAKPLLIINSLSPFEGERDKG